jgi:hypothetical protein
VTFVFLIVKHNFLPVAQNVWKEPEDNEEAATSPHFTAHRRVPKVAEEKLWLVIKCIVDLCDVLLNTHAMRV